MDYERLAQILFKTVLTFNIFSVKVPSWDISFWILPRKSVFVKDFSDNLTNNKFNKKIVAITPTPYLNSLIPNYLITLINTL